MKSRLSVARAAFDDLIPNPERAYENLGRMRIAIDDTGAIFGLGGMKGGSCTLGCLKRLPLPRHGTIDLVCFAIGLLHPDQQTRFMATSPDHLPGYPQDFHATWLRQGYGATLRAAR
jgi:hypothetical protein